MVNDGSTSDGLASVKFERERIRLPVHIVEGASHPRLIGKDSISCWALVVTPGRYRLLAQPKGPPAGDLARILQKIKDAEAPGEDVLDHTDNNDSDAIGARLIPCTVSPSKTGWRVNFPQVAKNLVPEKEEPSFVFVRIVAGFIEIWFPDTLRRAVSAPISGLLS